MSALDSRDSAAPVPHRALIPATIMTRDCAKYVLASLTARQREAVAVFVETSRPWADMGLDFGADLTHGDAECVLGIVADGLRLQYESGPLHAVPSLEDGSAWLG